MQRFVALHPDAVTLDEEGMTDEIVIGSLIFNRDGSITVSAMVNVYHPDGRVWSMDRHMRLKLKR